MSDPTNLRLYRLRKDRYQISPSPAPPDWRDAFRPGAPVALAASSGVAASSASIRMPGRSRDLLGRAHLHQLAVLHHRNPVGEIAHDRH